MNKKNFIKPSLQVVKLNIKDIIATSGCDGDIACSVNSCDPVCLGDGE